MFVDDTTAYVVADNIDTTIGKLNRMANEIQQWCSNNKLRKTIYWPNTAHTKHINHEIARC